MADKDPDAKKVMSNKGYLAMMLLAFFAAPTGLARIYRGDKSLGWARFWTFVACILLGMIGSLFIPLALLVSVVEIGLGVWGVVDFFLLYGVKTDATGKELLGTAYDRKFAKVLMIVYIVLISLSVVGAIVGLLIVLALIASASWDSVPINNGAYNMPMYNNSRTSELFSASEANSIQNGMTKAHVESILHGATGDCNGDTSFENCMYNSSSSYNRNSVSVTYQDGTVSSVDVY